VVKIISDDSNNPLVNYAVKNSSSVAAMVSSTNTESKKWRFGNTRDKVRYIGWMTQYLQIQEIGQQERSLAAAYWM
jgi:hypothetical protein